LLFLRIGTTEWAAIGPIFRAARCAATDSASADGLQLFTASWYNAGTRGHGHIRSAHFADIGVHLFRYAGYVHPSPAFAAYGILLPQKALILSIEDAWVSLLGFGMLAIAMEPIRLVFPKSAGRHLYRLREEFGE
jgi:hypothetical protein